jgi:hypothetical protein
MSGQNEKHEVREDFNIPLLRTMVTQISEFVNTKRDEKPFDIEMALIEKYPDFYNEYPFIIKKIVITSAVFVGDAKTILKSGMKWITTLLLSSHLIFAN